MIPYLAEQHAVAFVRPGRQPVVLARSYQYTNAPIASACVAHQGRGAAAEGLEGTGWGCYTARGRVNDVTDPRSAPRLPLPAWARWADILTFALLGGGVLVAAFGGARLHLFGARLSLTSPWRVLVWALLVAALRHAIVGRDPIYRRLADGVRVGDRRAVFSRAWLPFLGTRLPVLLVAYFAVLTIGYPMSEPPNRVSSNELLNLMSRWDAGWYRGIAGNGYSWSEAARPEVQQNIVFFPAYPMLMRLVGRLVGSRLLLAGLLVSLVTFFAALCYLFRLARQWLDDEQAVTALWLLASYPFALFFSATYTESLYLCGAAAAFFHMHRREWGRAGAWGLLVGLTRPNGCFLSLPLAVVALGHLAPNGPGAWAARWRRFAWGEAAVGAPPDGVSPARTAAAGLAAAAMPGVGMLAYSAFIYSLTGDALAWARGHAAWGRNYASVLDLVFSRYQYLSGEGLYQYTRSVPTEALYIVALVFVLGMTWPVCRRFGFGYGLFLLLNVLPPLAAGGFLSMGRFTAVLFPAFFALAVWVSPRARPAWVAGFGMGQALSASLFFTWRPLY